MFFFRVIYDKDRVRCSYCSALKSSKWSCSSELDKKYDKMNKDLCESEVKNTVYFEVMIMHTVQLSYLLESVSSDSNYLSLLTGSEKSFSIVLKRNKSSLTDSDLKEIVEAVIMENTKDVYVH